MRNEDKVIANGTNGPHETGGHVALTSISMLTAK
jgi:hypothetical protein